MDARQRRVDIPVVRRTQPHFTYPEGCDWRCQKNEPNNADQEERRRSRHDDERSWSSKGCSVGEVHRVAPNIISIVA